MKALGSKTMQPCEKPIREYKQTGEMWNEWKNRKSRLGSIHKK